MCKRGNQGRCVCHCEEPSDVAIPPQERAFLKIDSSLHTSQ